MYSGRGMSGRTRFRQGISGKQYFENDNKRIWKRREVEEIAYQEEWCSSDTVSVSSYDYGKKDVSRSRGIAGRTRSHFSASKFKNTKSGTFSNPINLDNEEGDNETTRPPENLASSSDEYGNPKVTPKPRRKDLDDLKIISEHPHGEGVAPLENLASSSDEFGNPRVTPEGRREECDDLEILSEHHHGKGVAPLENLASSSDEYRNQEATPKGRRKECDDLKILSEHGGVAPLENSASSSDEYGNLKVMRKRLKASHPLEKLESEDELDKLWAEANMKDDESDEAAMTCPSSKGTFGTREPEEVGKLLTLSAYEDEAGVQEDIMPCLSSKSTSGTEASQPLEKSESEDESDYLWAELEEGLEDDKEVENNQCDDPRPEGEDNIAARCERGDHYPIMNEEIGILCKYCLHLIQDIKDCDPKFGKNPSGRSGGRYSPRLDDADDSFSDSVLENSGIDDKSSTFVACAPTGTVWDIVPRAKKSMYDHQHEAFEFLWTNLAGGIVLSELEKQLNFASGSGCIISHAPGTGKTFLTISFLSAFMRKYPNCRSMIIAPTNILHTWERELKKWKVGDPVPFHNLNKHYLSGEESRLPRRSGGNRGHSKIAIRWAKLCSWREATSILGISYTLFDRLARKGSDNVKKALFELPGLVVLDEGHTPRNSRSLLWEALSHIKTKRRIILSGTPFQNNFKELHNTLRLAKPNETKGNLEYLLKSYDRVESESERNEIIAEIKDVIKPFVHVHKGTVLQEKLPGLMESILCLIPSQTQMLIFKYIQKLRNTSFRGKEGSYNWFKFEYWMSVASVHPSLLVAELSDLPERERGSLNAILERLKSSPESGVKTKFVIDFIRQSERIKEKVLIFSQYIIPLTFLANQIKSHFHWNEGEQMIVVHGKTNEGIRQASIDAFNDPSSKARVMLASTKACYEGINLVGASRVILLDTLWNPSAERQAVSRAYRIGQRKIVYTYRLISVGTWDEQKLCIQAEKDKLSESVFFGSDEDGHHHNREDKLLEKMGRKFDTKITKRGVTILLESEER